MSSFSNFVDEAGVTRLRATGGGGGGSSPVGCLLYASDGIPIDDAGTPHYFIWDTLYDNVNEDNELETFPPGMGLDPAGVGTDTITTTESGIWTFTTMLSIPPDATWTGDVIFGNFGFINGPDHFIGPPVGAIDADSGTRRYLLSLGPMVMPAGMGFSMGVLQRRAATGVALMTAGVQVAVTRLG